MLLIRNTSFRHKFKGSSVKLPCRKPQLKTLLNKKERKIKQVRPLKRYGMQLVRTLPTFHPMNLGSIFLLFSKLLSCQVLSIKSYDGARWTLSLMRTDLEFAGKGLYIKVESKTVTVHNRKKQKVIRYATLVAIQKGERPLTLAFLPVLLGQKRKDTVATLLKFVQGMHLKPRLILMDGGVAVTELLQHLDDAKLPWVCRGSRMKKREYPDPVFEAEFRRKKYRVRSFLVDKRTLLHSSRLYRGSLEQVKKDYKRRFQIEHTYRSAKELRVVTSSRSVIYRWAVWSFSLYLELLWKLLCLVALSLGFTLREFRLRLLKREVVKLLSSDPG